MTTLLLISAGGFIGANIRFAIAAWASRSYGSVFPLGTAIANVAGSFMIGLILGMIDDRETRLLLATGLLGAETTFSTFVLETLHLSDRGKRGLSATNVALNVVGALLAVVAGLTVAWLLRNAA